MMQGAGESQDGWGTPIFNMDAQKWTPSGKIANAAFQKITLTNLVRDMKQSGATEQQIGMRVLQFQIAGQALSSYSLSDQVDALYGTGMSLGTMLNVMSIKRGKAFSMDEIKAITNRYNSHSGSLVTANGVVIKDKPQPSTVSESRGANQSGGKGTSDSSVNSHSDPAFKNGYKWKPENDLDLRGTEKTFQDALNEAFKRTGYNKSDFTPVRWSKTADGKSIPVQYNGPNGATVNVDIEVIKVVIH